MSNPSIKSEPTLADLQAYVRAMMAVRHLDSGPQYIPKEIMLLTEEIGELSKAYRKISGMKYARDSVQEQSVAEEAADILFVLLAICNMLDIDLEQALRDKEEKNKKRMWT